MKSTVGEDRALLSRCFSGDREAEETLVRQYSNLVYYAVQRTLMMRHVPYNSQDLEDLHNTIFLRLFEAKGKKLRQYQGKNGCSLATWIRTVAARTVLDHLRKRGVNGIAAQERKIPLEEIYGLASDDSNALTLIERAEKEQLLRQGLQHLSSRDRLFIKLHFDRGLALTEVAEAMQLSMDNAYTIKHRAVKKLRTHLDSTLAN